MMEKFLIPGIPIIPGLIIRRFRGESDYPLMAALIEQCKIVDGLERTTAVDDIARTYRHLENSDPQKDMLFVEVGGQLISYGRIWWDELADGTLLYHPFGYLHPDWRGKGIGSALWQAAEERVHAIAMDQPAKNPKFLQVEPFQSETAMVKLLIRFGYQPARYETHMLRNLNEPFPEAPMPPGLDVRPVEQEHLRLIFDASNEAFRDHWGVRDQSEEEYKAELESPDFRPQYWKVAWDGDQVASVIHNFFDEKENSEFKRKRGYTEGICTRRPWRKRGLARSLLVQSMLMFKEMGFTETALSVDSENLSGALQLYEGVGYKKIKQQIIYRKPVLSH